MEEHFLGLNSIANIYRVLRRQLFCRINLESVNNDPVDCSHVGEVEICSVELGKETFQCVVLRVANPTSAGVRLKR